MRLRLTLLYGGLFLLAGAGLLAVNYALVRSHFTLPITARIEAPGDAAAAPDVLRPASGTAVLVIGPAPGEGEEGLVARAPSPADLEVVRRRLQAAALHQLLAQSGVALALMALASVGLGWLVAGRVLRPLQAITAAARRLEGNTLHQRINLQGPEDELKELADTLDHMLGRLDAAFESQRRFVANASHELRTPLTLGRALVEVAMHRESASPDVRE
ncbi:MAG TPA: HAMP domain-containing protein, partial [Actinomycetes bacterium]|nr:HAMP domain-containing protein [Actinomycetes bacterium]